MAVSLVQVFADGPARSFIRSVRIKKDAFRVLRSRVIGLEDEAAAQMAATLEAAQLRVTIGDGSSVVGSAVVVASAKVKGRTLEEDLLRNVRVGPEKVRPLMAGALGRVSAFI